MWPRKLKVRYSILKSFYLIIQITAIMVDEINIECTHKSNWINFNVVLSGIKELVFIYLFIFCQANKYFFIYDLSISNGYLWNSFADCWIPPISSDRLVVTVVVIWGWNPLRPLEICKAPSPSSPNSLTKCSTKMEWSVGISSTSHWTLPDV